jgi:hypothetical protein
MEGESYAIIWGVMHFQRFLHKYHFTLKIDHKPLEWLATVSNAYGQRGHWMLHPNTQMWNLSIGT